MATTPRLFRVILPTSSIEAATEFYAAVLQQPGVRVSPGRHYFACGPVILACFDPRADGDPWNASANPDHVYLAVSDLEACYERVIRAGGHIREPIQTQPWGERSFYCSDPHSNRLGFVDEQTLFTAELL